MAGLQELWVRQRGALPSANISEILCLPMYQAILQICVTRPNSLHVSLCDSKTCMLAWQGF